MITLIDLQTGVRPRISEKEFARLRGCSTSTLQKERLRGTGPEFLKDPVNGRVSYSAEAVLAFFNRSIVCKSTSNYDTHSHQERLEKARAMLHQSLHQRGNSNE